MSEILTESTKLVNKNFTLYKKVYFSDNFYNQKLKYNGHDLIIQTPYIINRYKPSRYDDKITLDLIFDKEWEEYEPFLKFLKKIIKIYKLKMAEVIDIKNKTFSNSIKKKKFGNIFKLKFHNYNDDIYIKTYDTKGRKISNSNISFGKEIRFLIHLDSFWVWNDSYGFNWYAVQCEIKKPSCLSSYAFKNEKSSIEENPAYRKYFKMINVGIPKEAVKNKMKLEGIDPSILDNNGVEKSSIPPPPPPINMFDFKSINLQKNDNKSNNSNNSNNLNKNNDNIEKEKNNEIRVPTMAQLQEQIAKMRSTKNKKK